MMRDHTTPICPLPGLGHCVRERCNFWDEDREECTAACFEARDQAQSDYSFDSEGPCVINFQEDHD